MSNDNNELLDDYIAKLSDSLAVNLVETIKARKRDNAPSITSIYLSDAPTLDLSLKVSAGLEDRLNELREDIFSKWEKVTPDYEIVDYLCRLVVHFVPFNDQDNGAYGINIGQFFKPDGSPRLKNL